MALEREALTERIIAAAIEVHRRLGARHCFLRPFLPSCLPQIECAPLNLAQSDRCHAGDIQTPIISDECPLLKSRGEAI